jgi:hypothetical protein
MRITLILFFVFALTEFSQSQVPNFIIILNQSDSTAVPFAQIYNRSTFQGTVSDINGRFELKKSDSNYTLEIRHIDYKTKRFTTEELSKLDTVFLLPRTNFLPVVIVDDSKRNALYKSLNKLLKSVRNNMDSNVTSTYAYYLESELNSQNVEKIKAIINFDYGHKKGFLVDDFYCDYGEFLFDSNAPFVNLQTNEWLLEFDPFSQKKYDDYFLMPTNSSKIKRKKFFLQQNSCAYCSEDEISISIFSRLDSSQMIVIYDEKINTIKEVSYSIENSDKYSFLRLNNQVIPIKKLTVNYVFNTLDESVELINFTFNLCLENATDNLKVRGFLKKEIVVESNLLVLGNFKPSSIYEQIILNPSNYQNEIDLLFTNEPNGFDLSDEGYLSSSTDSIKTSILQLDGTNQVKYWNNERLKVKDYDFLHTESEYYIDALGQVILFEDVIDVSWIFNFKKHKETYEIDSYPSLWNVNASLLISKSYDTLFSAFKANVIFDFYEIRRLELLSVIRDKLKKGIELAVLKKYIKRFYKSTQEEVKLISIHITLDEVNGFLDLIHLNDTLCGLNDIDNLLEVYCTQFNTIIEYPTYYSILNKYTKLGYQLKHKPQLANSCFNKAIVMSNLLIKYYKTLPGSTDKQLGAYYSVLSELYHEVGEYDKECTCLAKLKNLWPEGFIYHKKNRYEIRCQ